MDKPIVAWSHSALELFENCPKKYYHLKVKKDFKEEFTGPEAESGVKNHKSFEQFLVNGTRLPLDLQHHQSVLVKLREAPGDSYPEQQLAINKNFEPTGWFDRDVYGRAILDFMKVNRKTAVLIDHKFGKMHDDFSQLQLFIAFVSIFLPDVTDFTAAYYWAKHRRFTRIRMQRKDVMSVWTATIPRVQRLEEAIKTTDFPAKQSGLCKKHCVVTSCPFNGNYRP